MHEIQLTDDEQAILINIVATHWAAVEVNRMITEEELGLKGTRPAVLDAVFFKVTGMEPPEISEYLVFTEGPVGGRQPKEMADVEVLRTVLEKLSAVLPTYLTGL